MNRKKRIIFFTGKGGVGKTTIASATALVCSELGYKTLVISIDPAHSLRDVFGKKLSSEPCELKHNLFAQEVDVYYSIGKYWGELKNYLVSLFKWRGIEDILSEELSILPGMEEIAGFLWVNLHYENGDYECIILDSAPTGDTLRFLSLPDITKWWFRKILPVQKKVVQIVRPAVKMVSNIPVPEDSTYDAVKDLFDNLYSLHHILQNKDISSVRIVVNPEKMVLKESQRAYTYLGLFGYPVDALVLNRVMENKKKELSSFLKIQEKYIKKIEEYFTPLPVFEAPMLTKEVLGFKNLLELGEKLYKGKDPTNIFYRDTPFEIKKDTDGYNLFISMPFASKRDINVMQKEDEIVIHYETRRRHIFLPRSLSEYSVQNAEFKQGKLKIFLKKEDFKK